MYVSTYYRAPNVHVCNNATISLRTHSGCGGGGCLASSSSSTCGMSAGMSGNRFADAGTASSLCNLLLSYAMACHHSKVEGKSEVGD